MKVKKNKLKTHKGLSKVCKVRPGGTIKIGKPGTRHNTGKKNAANNRVGRSASSMSKADIKRLTNDGWFYIGGGYTDSEMNYLSTGSEATEYLTKLFNKYCEIRGVEKIN